MCCKQVSEVRGWGLRPEVKITSARAMTGDEISVSGRGQSGHHRKTGKGPWWVEGENCCVRWQVSNVVIGNDITLV